MKSEAFLATFVIAKGIYITFSPNLFNGGVGMEDLIRKFMNMCRRIGGELKTSRIDDVDRFACHLPHKDEAHIYLNGRNLELSIGDAEISAILPKDFEIEFENSRDVLFTKSKGVDKVIASDAEVISAFLDINRKNNTARLSLVSRRVV